MGALPRELALSCLRPTAACVHTFKEKRSEFIAALFPAATAEEARTALEVVRLEHRQATHNCPAWRIGFPATEEFSSDDGEPSGTAGRPILGELRKKELCNAVVVVTRYFGGVKLGVRGLIDAYMAAAAGVIAAAPTERVAPFHIVRLRCGYDALGSLTRALKAAGVEERRISTRFAEDVAVEAFVAESQKERLSAHLCSYDVQKLLAAPPLWDETSVLAPVE